jgi:hypothetical protein
MRKLLTVLLAFGFAACGNAAPDAEGPMATVQRLFDAMAGHDASGIRAVFTPDALLFGVDANGAPSAMPSDKFAERIGASKDALLERIWNPKVLEHGSIAVVWAEYDFHRNGIFHHCGIDSFNLLKTANGWKIAAAADTRETTGCAPSPLGPPAK